MAKPPFLFSIVGPRGMYCSGVLVVRRLGRIGFIALASLTIFSIAFLSLAYVVTADYPVENGLREAQERFVHVPYTDLSDPFIQSVLSVEDHRFFSHPGFDPFAFVRAMTFNASAGAFVQGGSTLTQQLAKNLFLTPERTFSRKFLELGLSMRIERVASKEEIFELYVNSVPYGRNARGVGQASTRYFGLEPNSLTWPEATLLAGLPQAPGLFDPERYPERAIWRQGLVVSTLVLHGVVDEAEAENILRAPLPFRDPDQEGLADARLPVPNPDEG
jgi:monofunctional glycosyltransferase